MHLLKPFVCVAAVALVISCSGKKSDDGPAKSKPTPGNKTQTTVVTTPPPPAVQVACDGPAKTGASVWNDSVKTKLTAAVDALKLAHGADTTSRVSQRLDASVRELGEAAKGKCDSRKAMCLARVAGAMGALVTELSKPDNRSVERALRAVYRLPAVADCNNIEFVTAVPSARADARDKVRKVYDHVDRLRVRLHLGRTKGVGMELKAVVLGARRVGYAPALAEALELQARAFRARNKLNHAQQSLRLAAKTAAGAQDHWRVASVWIELVSVLVDSRRVGDAFKVVKGAEVAIKRSKNTRSLEQRLHEAMAMANYQAGKYADAVASADKALANVSSGDDIASAGVLFLRAAALQADKKNADAEKVYQRLQPMVTKAFGSAHPMVGRVLIALGQTQIAQQRTDDGVKTINAAIAAFVKTYGADHLHVASARASLAAALVSANKYKQALDVYGQVLAARTKTAGPEHRSVGRTHLSIARALFASGDKTKAQAAAKKAREVFEKAKSKGGVAAADKLLKKLTAP